MKQRVMFILTVVVGLLFWSAEAMAHCDTMNGPVVKAAEKALSTGDVRYVLVWVKEKDEAEIRKAFDKTMAVRKLGGDAKALADRYFFETLVRVHRAGEGAPYTGLKDADTPVEPGIAQAEEALDKGTTADLTKELAATLKQGVEEAFKQVQSTKPSSPTDVQAGRRNVEAYVNYIHYIERLHKAVAPSSEPEHGTTEAHVD